MDQNRIFELALEGLEKRKAEIAAIQAELNGMGSTVRQAGIVSSAGRKILRTTGSASSRVGLSG